MSRFEYEITRHPAEELRQLVYFCTEQGECGLNQVPSGEVGRLRNMLNERGTEGWELVQLSFGQDGVLAFWKRAV